MAFLLAGIGSFVNEAIRVDFGDSIQSLILLRTPMYENVLEESERGVTVSLEDQEDDDLLQEVDFDRDAATIKLRTESRKYDLDLRKVDPVELEEMCSVFRKMNFDQKLQLSGILVK